MQSRHRRSEDGSSLVIVLIVISVFGLILAGLMTESGASLKFTNTVSEHEAKVYAADAGVQYGIQQLRQNNEVCPNPADAGAAIPDLTVDGRTVTVTCAANSGSTTGGLGYSVITTSLGAGSLTLSNSHAKTFRGPVFVSGGVNWGPGLALEDGNFYQKAGGASCTVGAATPAGLTLENPPYQYLCTPVATPDPPHSPPAVPTAAGTFSDSGACRTFRPGLYTAPPSLLANNYFASGVYYFNFDGVFSVFQASVYGGQPAPNEQRLLSAPPACAQADPAGTTGTGVLFVFGHRARLSVDTQGQLELFARTGDASATSRLSFVSVPGDGSWAGWAPNTLPATTNVLEIKEGNPQNMAVHGMVYAPNQSVVLTATNSVIAQTLGGIVAHALEVKSSASAGNLAVSAEYGAPDPREVLITATAYGPGAGERPVVSSAIVSVQNDAARTTAVRSWRTRGPSD